MIFYEAPHKLKNTLNDMYKYFGNRNISLCRELTKIHEESIAFTLASGLAGEKRGEYVLLVEGAGEKQNPLCALSEREHILHYMRAGVEKKEALKKAAKDRGVSKSDLYPFAIDL